MKKLIALMILVFLTGFAIAEALTALTFDFNVRVENLRFTESKLILTYSFQSQADLISHPTRFSQDVILDLEDYSVCRSVGKTKEMCLKELNDQITQNISYGLDREVNRLKQLQKQSFISEIRQTDINPDITALNQKGK